MIYLSTPYRDPNPDVVEQRYQACLAAAAEMMRTSGKPVFSLIAHSHPIVKAHDLPTSTDFWLQYMREMIAASELVVVVMLPGWNESEGVWAERRIAAELGVSVMFKEPL